MKVIIQLQYSLTDIKVFHDVKNNLSRSQVSTQPNPTHGWIQPMTNSVIGNQKTVTAYNVLLTGVLNVCVSTGSKPQFLKFVEMRHQENSLVVERKWQ